MEPLTSALLMFVVHTSQLSLCMHTHGLQYYVHESLALMCALLMFLLLYHDSQFAGSHTFNYQTTCMDLLGGACTVQCHYIIESPSYSIHGLLIRIREKPHTTMFMAQIPEVNKRYIYYQFT